MKYRFGLLIIIIVGALLRGVGLDATSYHTDEKTVVRTARYLLDKKTLEPKRMSYGTLTPYLQAGVLALGDRIHHMRGGRGAKQPFKDDLEQARALSAFAGVITILLTAALAREMLKKRHACFRSDHGIALSAAMISAFSFLAVQCNHYSTVDSVMAMLTTAALLVSLKALHEGRVRYHAGAGLLAGLAAAAKYTGGLVILPPLLAALIGRKHRAPRRNPAIVLAGGLLGFALGMPPAFLTTNRFLSALRFESHHYAQGGETILAMGDHTGWWNLRYLFHTGLGPALLLMALFGLAWMLSRSSSHALAFPAPSSLAVFLIYPAACWIFLARYPVRFDRNLLPLIPILAVMAALWWNNAWQAMKMRRRTALSILAGIALPLALLWPLSKDIVFDWQLRQTHTRDQLKAWIRTHARHKKIRKHTTYHRAPLGWYQRHGYDYIIMSSHSWEPILGHPERYPILARFYKNMFKRCEIVALFENPWFASDFFAPHALLNSATVNIYHGPTMAVLKVPPLDAPNSGE